MFLTARHSGRPPVASEPIESATEVVRMKRAEAQAIDLHHYTELELSPKAVLWAGHITNPNLQCAGISHISIGMTRLIEFGAPHSPLECGSSGLQWGAKLLKAENRWKAFLFVPWVSSDEEVN